MKISVTQTQDVPNSMYCNERGGLCYRVQDLEKKALVLTVLAVSGHQGRENTQMP